VLRRILFLQADMKKYAVGIFPLVSVLLGASGVRSLTSHVTSEKEIRREIKTDYSVSDAAFRTP